ncbi:MAG: HEAT repeat domain-containing protein, partial [Planctomycetota bacterium]
MRSTLCASHHRLVILNRILAVLIFNTSASVAFAQDRLDPGFSANPAIWNADEREQAQTFVQTQIERVMTGEESAISRGRAALVEALTFPGGTDLYVSQLSETIAQNLAPAMAADDLIVRVNAMVICTYVDHPDALPAIENGLKDPNAGVRYPAANAIANLLAGDGLTNSQRRDALNTLKDLATREQDAFVVKPMLDALAQTQDNALVLDVLNDRVQLHAAQPSVVYDAEANTLQVVYTRIYTVTNPPADVVRDLAKVSARYLKLTAGQLAENSIPGDRNRSLKNIMNIAATALRATHEGLAAPGRAPDRPDPAIQQENWQRVVNIADEWVGVLQLPP